MASSAGSITTASSCAGCVFGAFSSAFHSYTYHAVETIDVSVNTYITVFPNGINSTSYESITQTKTVFAGDNATATLPPNATYFDSPNDITWTVGNATLTYPTTYVEYLAFGGAAPSNGACASQNQAKRIELPLSTTRESFIYAYTTEDLLPTQLLEYLDTIPTITEQIDDETLSSCEPLTVTPAPSPIIVTLDPQPAKRFEGARKDEFGNQMVVDGGVNNGTYLLLHGRQASGGTGTGTGAPSTPTSTAFISMSSTSPWHEAGSTASLGAPAKDHTTAYVINVITGRNIVIPAEATAEATAAPVEAPPAPTPTGDANDERPVVPGSGNGDGGGEEGGNGGGSPESTDQASIPVAGIVGGVQSAAEQANSNNEQSQTADNVIGAINTIATNQDSNEGSLGPTPAEANSQIGPQPTPAPETVPPINGVENQAAQQTNPAVANSHPADFPMFNVGNTIVSANSDGKILFGTQVLSPGQTVTVGHRQSGTPVAFETGDGSHRLLVGDSTYQPISRIVPTAHDVPAVISANGQAYTATPSDGSILLIGASSTIKLGSAQTLVDGQTISAASDGSAVIVNGETLTLPNAASPAGAIVTANGQLLTVVDQGGFMILKGRTTTIAIQDGSQTVINGQTFSAMPSDTAAVINGKTIAIPSSASTSAAEMIITPDGNTFTAIDAESSIILKDGTTTATIKDGSQTTFEGQTISALPGGNGVVFDGSITTIFGPSPTSTGIGDYINSGLVSSPTSTRDNPVTTNGSASHSHILTSASILSVIFLIFLFDIA